MPIDEIPNRGRVELNVIKSEQGHHPGFCERRRVRRYCDLRNQPWAWLDTALVTFVEGKLRNWVRESVVK